MASFSVTSRSRHLVDGHEIGEVHGQLGHLRLEPFVLREERLHHVLELAPLPRRHAVEQRLHLRRLLPELLEELVEAFRSGEALAPLVLEGLEVGLSALRPLA
jgi:hypothetical protein